MKQRERKRKKEGKREREAGGGTNEMGSEENSKQLEIMIVNRHISKNLIQVRTTNKEELTCYYNYPTLNCTVYIDNSPKTDPQMILNHFLLESHRI